MTNVRYCLMTNVSCLSQFSFSCPPFPLFTLFSPPPLHVLPPALLPSRRSLNALCGRCAQELASSKTMAEVGAVPPFFTPNTNHWAPSGNASGALPDVVPWGGWPGGYPGDPNWALAGVVVPWEGEELLHSTAI
jgi:hypothetical protein